MLAVDLKFVRKSYELSRWPRRQKGDPTGSGDGAKISPQRTCDPSTRRALFVEPDAGAVNLDLAEKTAGNVIRFPYRASISQGKVG